MVRLVAARRSLVALIVLLPAAGVAATPPAPTLSSELPALVGTDWLGEHLADPDVVVLHIGAEGSYENGHIPGARPFSVRSVLAVTPTGVRDELPGPGELSAALGGAGVSDDSRVVIAIADEVGMPFAARVFFTLEYAGLGGRVAVLDGGVPAWRAEGRPVTGDAATFLPTTPAIRAAAEVVADAAWLAARLDEPGVAVIDARPPELYAGTAAHGAGSRPGHIPAAVNLPFFTLTHEDAPSRFKDRDELRRLFEDAGAGAGTQVVVYCGTGIWASPVYLAARYVGLPVRLYDGSYQEWTMDERRPVVAPVTKSQIR